MSNSNITHMADRRANLHDRLLSGATRSTTASVTPLRVRDRIIPPNPTLPPGEALETALDTYRSTQLELAHKREAFELQMHVELCTAKIRLEASAFKAMLAGVPESDIYALGEDMAEALESAMNTVADA